MIFLYVIVIAWLYVAVLMAAATAISPTGSLFAAIMTFFFYGLLPLALVVYLMTGRLRRKARLAAEDRVAADAAVNEAAAGAASDPGTDAGRHAPAGTEAGSVASVRKEA